MNILNKTARCLDFLSEWVKVKLTFEKLLAILMPVSAISKDIFSHDVLDTIKNIILAFKFLSYLLIFELGRKLSYVFKFIFTIF